MPLSVQAKEINYISHDISKSVIKNIDQFFKQYPEKKYVMWSPKIKGKSIYSFTIPRDAYLISKKYTDASDLYYLSEHIDNGLKSQPYHLKNMDIIISENNSHLILSQNILSDIHVGLFFKNKEKKSFGFNLNKDFIVLTNSLANFGVEQARGEYPVLNAKFVKLSKTESSEFYGNINHEFRSDSLNGGIGYTWFELANQFDLTLGVHEQDKEVVSELYATFDDENMKFQIGLNRIKNNSNINMFFNLRFEDIIYKKKLATNFILTSKNSLFAIRNFSLKNFKKKNLDKLWKKHINYN